MMTVHVLHAGDGYTYLTRQVAAGDVTRQRGDSLTDYYVHDGNPPGRWVGEGLVALDVSGQVAEAQMKALFGEGRHPDADRLEKALVDQGLDPKEAMSSTQLGRRFPQFKQQESDGFDAAAAAAYRAFEREHGHVPEPGVERDLVRWNVARTVLTGLVGAEPTDAEVARYLSKRGAAQRQPVAGYDLVFTPVKSVSTLWGLGDEHVRREVEASHESAWRSTLAWLETEAALTRVGAGGVAQVATRGLVATAFDHLDSRTGDPNLHTHVAISNKVQGMDGKWRALDGRVVHALGVAASERYNTLIETEVTNRLGVRFVEEFRPRARQPVREIAGVPLEVRKSFSSRRASIEESYDELIANYRAQYGHEPSKAMQFKIAQQATLDTRQAKDEGITYTQRRTQWRAQAAGILGSPEAVDEMVRGALTPSLTGPAQPKVSAEELAARVLDGIAETRAVWTVGHVQAEAQRVARAYASEHPTAGAAVLADDLTRLALAMSLPLTPPIMNPVPDAMRRTDGESIYRAHATERFTSVTVLAAEDRLLHAATTTAGVVVGQGFLAGALAQYEQTTGRTLNDGQRELARRFAASGHLVEAGIGPAGTGKTTSMTVFARAAEAAGARVLGLAPSAAAAAVLGDELGIGADTIAKLLWTHKDDQAFIPEHLRIDERTILLVDEAGMASTPDLDRLVELAARNGASVRLLGDTGQLQAVGAGGVLRLIDAHIGAAHLDEVHRFTTPGEAEASLAIRDGDESGLDFYIQARRTTGGTRDALVEDLYARWWADFTAGKKSLMIAASSDDVTRLSMRARYDRITAGHVEHDGVQLHDESTAGVGDTIVTRRNSRDLRVETGTDFVKNGDLWTVVERGDDGTLRVRHNDHFGFVTLPGDYVRDDVELGYASTTHRVQGMTVDTAHYLLDGGTTREQMYTGSTRGRTSNRMYVVTDELLEVDLHEQAAPARAVRASLEAVLARTETTPSATATLDEEYDRALTLAQLVPEYEDAYARFLDPGRDDRMAAALRTALPEDLAEQVLEDEAWTSLRDRLARHEIAGHDVAEVLTAALEGREVSSASSLAKVLHYRIGEAPAMDDARALPAWVTPAPSQLAPTAAPTPVPDATAAGPLDANGSEQPAAPQDPAEMATRDRVLKINAAAFAWWSQQAREPGAWPRTYLAGRGLGDIESGFAPQGWRGLVDALTAQGYTDADLLEADLASTSKRGQLIDRFRDRLVMPVRNEDDRIIAFTARRNPDELREDVPKYINSSQTPVYSKGQVLYGLDGDARARLVDGATPVLVEGAMDHAAFMTLGADIVPLAPLGTSVTQAQLDALRALTPGGLASLVVALDPDNAGRKAAVRVWSMLDPAEAATARAVELPDGLDPADLVKSGRGSELHEALNATRPLVQVVIDQVLAQAKLEHVEGRIGALRTIAGAVAPLPSEAMSGVAMYVSAAMGTQLSPLTIIDELISAHLDAHPAPAPAQSAPASTQADATTERETPESVDDEQVRQWVDAQADLIAARLDALVLEVEVLPPTWAAAVAPLPADEQGATVWRAAVRQVVAFRDQYGVTGAEPVPVLRARGAQEQARAAAMTAYRKVAAPAPAQSPTSDSVPRARRRVVTAQRVDEVLRCQQAEAQRERLRRLAGQGDDDEQGQGETLDDRLERLRRLRDEQRAREQDWPPTQGPETGGPHL